MTSVRMFKLFSKTISKSLEIRFKAWLTHGIWMNAIWLEENSIWSVIRQKGESEKCVCVSRSKKCSFSGKSGVFCFLKTSVLRLKKFDLALTISRQPREFLWIFLKVLTKHDMMELVTSENIKEYHEKNWAVLNCIEVIWGLHFTLLILECREKEIVSLKNFGMNSLNITKINKNNNIILRKIKKTMQSHQAVEVF